MSGSNRSAVVIDSCEGPAGAGSSPGAFLQSSGISKSYGGVHALKGVSLRAEAGEVRALLGENGAGKSTFVKVLTGAVTPDAGELTIAGEKVGHLTPRMARDRHVAAVFQELSLIPHLTAAENIWFPYEPLTTLGTRSQRVMRKEAKRLFGELGFPPVDLSTPTSELSLGERQLVEIAKAVGQEPKILVLDEATSALGPSEARLVLEMTRRLAAEGTLCLYISHRLAEVREVADSMTVFRNGEVVADLGVAEATDDEVINHIIGRRLKQLYPPHENRRRDRVVLGCRNLTGGNLLNGVDLELHEGEILGIGGLQGQGQLELFLRLFGVLHGGGEIEVGGKARRISSPRNALSSGIGLALIPEDRQREGALLDKSIRENVALTRLGSLSRFGLIDRRAERTLSDAAIATLNIACVDAGQKVGSLSGGNQQKVVIAKFLHQQIRTVLWYDPTRGVDIGAKQEIFKLMHEQAAEGRAALFFSTDSEELINVCDRVIVLAGGRVSAELARDDLGEEALMRASLALDSKGGASDV